MKLTIYEKNPTVAEALRIAFAPYAGTSVVLGGFEHGDPFDCFVTAGNSFGRMDGGVDRALVRYFGRELEERIQSLIIDRFLGEQPVGSCMLVETGRTDRWFPECHPSTMCCSDWPSSCRSSSSTPPFGAFGGGRRGGGYGSPSSSWAWEESVPSGCPVHSSSIAFESRLFRFSYSGPESGRRPSTTRGFSPCPSPSGRSSTGAGTADSATLKRARSALDWGFLLTRFDRG